MKKITALILVMAICLWLCACGKSDACTCDCAQCAQCEKKEEDPADNASAKIEQSGNVIKFKTPIVVAEDEYLRVELVQFYEDYVLWTERGQPSSQKADSTTEGATLEKFVVFKLCNQTGHSLTTYLNDVYLGNDGADFFDMDGAARIDTAAGKKVLRTFLIQTGANTAVTSMEELYSLDGDFSIFHKGEDGVMRDNYRLKFSIPDALGSSAAPASDNSEAWKQFRDYLKEHGPVTVAENDDDPPKWHYQKKITIEEDAGTIQISSAGEGSVVSGIVRYRALSTMQFELPSNAKMVNVHDVFLEEGTDENGNRREKSGSTSYTWDIQNYHYGDEITYAMDYSELDKNGGKIQKNGIVTATDAYAAVANALNQTLVESGLDVTMADLGFANY